MLNGSDDDLAVAARDGDRAALEELLARNFNRVHLICRRITCHPEDAKDATQEALIAVHRKLASFDGRSSFATWLYRVATNAALDEVRRRRRRPTPVDDLTAVSAGRGGETSVEQILSIRFDVDEALGLLAPDFRAPVVLRDLYGLEYTSIAAILGLPEGTVRSRLFRGRQAIRTLLRPPAQRRAGSERDMGEHDPEPSEPSEPSGEDEVGDGGGGPVGPEVEGHFVATPVRPGAPPDADTARGAVVREFLNSFVFSEEGWLVASPASEGQPSPWAGNDPDDLLPAGELETIRAGLRAGPVEAVDEAERQLMIQRALE